MRHGGFQIRCWEGDQHSVGMVCRERFSTCMRVSNFGCSLLNNCFDFAVILLVAAFFLHYALCAVACSTLMYHLFPHLVGAVFVLTSVLLCLCVCLCGDSCVYGLKQRRDTRQLLCVV